jgi:hypothetical protein
MSHNLNKKFEQNKISKEVKKSYNSQNILNGPSQKLPQTKFKTSKNKEPNLDSLNLLFFENNNTTGKKYFEEKRKEENQKKLTQNNQKENLNIQNIRQLLDLIKPNQDNLDDLDVSRNSSFSSEFSYSEENEKENERQEIIKTLIKPTDNISIIDFDIFDYSKMMFVDLNILFLNKTKKDKNENMDNCNLSTHTTDINNLKIELIKKAKKNGLENNEKRINKFKRNIKNEIIDKSKSIKRNNERSRSRFDYKKY